MTTEEQFKDRNWRRPFFIMWVGQALSLLGSQIVQFALVWHLTRETGSATVLTTATLVALLPQIFLGPIAGSIVDRGNRRRIMILADSSVALTTILLAVLFALGIVEIWHIYALMFIRSLGGAFHQPAFTASTTLMVPKEQLARVQGFNQTLQGGLSIFSAPLGALLLELLPMQGVLAVDVFTAILAVGSILFIAIPQPERKVLAEGEKRPSLWQDTRAGFSYVFTWPGLMVVLVMATLLNLLLTPAFALLPLLIRNYFGGGAGDLASIDVVFGIGVIAGGLLLGTWGGFKRRIVTAFIALIGLGIGTGAVGLVPANAFVWALVAFGFAGIMQPIVNGSLGATLQAVIDPGMQGRVFTLVGSLAMAMTPIGLLLAGPIADFLGLQTWYVLGGGLCIFMGSLAFLLPSVMKLEDGRPEPKTLVQAS
jgi:DHA3 family macrolide efflux protein-like MFS transporter